MWRVALILLLLLPPLAIAWNHDTWSSILLIGWTMLVLPVCILQGIDFFQATEAKTGRQARLVRGLLRIPIGLFGLLSLLIGLTIVAWCLYNVFVRRLPEYSGPDNPFVLLLSGFGVAPSLIAFGVHLTRLSLRRSV